MIRDDSEILHIDKNNASEILDLSASKFIFTLKKGIKFINDEEITAQHILFSLEQLKKSDNRIKYIIKNVSCDGEQKFEVSWEGTPGQSRPIQKKLKDIINFLNKQLYFCSY
ncbi:hypothetical protein [Italian clover phyllody phytoplasma]|uniref:hypothetical protein n=1 Tax=Italian clover phyllody phytoplasma TaxID=1196420 RepID=UPI00030C0755|nr:hypothetical protein [Italian clover phyllody phytoplasma]